MTVVRELRELAGGYEPGKPGGLHDLLMRIADDIASDYDSLRAERDALREALRELFDVIGGPTYVPNYHDLRRRAMTSARLILERATPQPGVQQVIPADSAKVSSLTSDAAGVALEIAGPYCPDTRLPCYRMCLTMCHIRTERAALQTTGSLVKP